jgi:predicted Zn finger-like uncharacterized protein
MKIACESCGTKYSIADDKVRGKVFKIRCKKCQNVIVVRGTEGGDAGHTTPAPHEMTMTPPPAADSFLAAEVSTSASMPAAPAAAAAAGAIWHVAIGKEQKGPFTAGEIKERARRGEINGETFVWREGLGDWKPLSDVAEFTDLLPATDVAREQPMFGTTRGDRGAADLFGKTDDGPTTGELRIGGGVVASELPEGIGHDMFGEADKAGKDAPPEAEMTGARHDTSVLFSLSNLGSMATGGKTAPQAAAKPSAPARTEGSGLIDIRKMAAGIPVQHSAASADMEALGGVFSPAVPPPVLLPMAPSGPPKWLWPVVAIGAVVVLGVGGMFAYVLTRKPTVVVQAPAPAVVPQTAGQAPGVAPPAPTQPAAAGPGTPAPAPAPAPVAVAETGRESRGPRKSSSGARGGSHHETSSSPPPSEPKAAQKPAPKKGGGDTLDELLAGAVKGQTSGGKTSGGEQQAAPAEDLPETLSRSQIQSGMSGIRPRVQACNAQYRVPGTVTVALTISRAGRIQTANVTGRFAGTPTGQCVEKAVKSATFPKFSGAPVSIDYPFVMN